MIEIIRKNASVEDNRGSLTEFDSTNFSQVNILISKKNTIRGNHYHKKLNEFFYVIEGELDLELINLKTKEILKKRIFKGDYFEITPYINHTLKFLEDSKILVGYNHKFNPLNPDIFVL